MQFSGEVTKEGVHLQFTHTTPNECYPDSETLGDRTDVIYCPGGKVYSRIWTAVRKPCGMFGCWVVFRYNGKEHVPDLSVPISVFKLPRDAKPMSIENTIKTWTT